MKQYDKYNDQLVVTRNLYFCCKINKLIKLTFFNNFNVAPCFNGSHLHVVLVP